jgi:hypothetical protein
MPTLVTAVRLTAVLVTRHQMMTSIQTRYRNVPSATTRMIGTSQLHES